MLQTPSSHIGLGYSNEQVTSTLSRFVWLARQQSTVLNIFQLLFKFLFSFLAHTNAVNSVSFHPSGNYMITASTDTTLKVLS